MRLPFDDSRPPPAVPARHALLAAITLLAGCATQPAGDSSAIHRWTQMGPNGEVSLRAIVAAGAACPMATVDGDRRPLEPRAAASPVAPSALTTPGNPAFQAHFEVTACELALPRSARQASIDGQPVALPLAAPGRIVVVGDTGCRIQVRANGSSPPIQDCASPEHWPWPRIAAAAAQSEPDLVIHVGDYHYREYCNDPVRCASQRDTGVPVGYGWTGWDADFFTPAAPLLKAAPWVVVRGNHENCDRGGEGWMRFLSPLPYRACGNQAYGTASRSVLTNNLTADAYRIDFGRQLTLVVADNAGFEDYLPASRAGQDSELLRRSLRALDVPSDGQPVWLLLHKPLWYEFLAASAQPNALQAHLRHKLPAELQFVFAGHQHVFATLNFPAKDDPAGYAAARPAQLIVGNSGTQLEAFDPQSPLFEGRSGAGSKERSHPDSQVYDGMAASSGILVNRYGFLLLERVGDAWTASLRDPDGRAITQCRLHGERKAVACDFPGR